MGSCAASIVICTRNRANSLARALRSLAASEPPESGGWEVIVVDNASTDDTASVIHRFADEAGRVVPIRTIREARPGLAHARNAGLRAARGEIILLTDDDCLVSAEWLRTALRLLHDDPMQLIGGRVELFDPEDLPLAIKTARERATLKDFSALWGFVHGANMAMGRAVIARIGGFDVRFGAGAALRSAEDTDFVFRAWRAGVPVVYEPDLLVHHHHGRRGARTWRRQSGDYAIGIGAMAAKHAHAGDYRLVKAAYWYLRAALRLWRDDRRAWPELRARLQVLTGALGYWRVRNRAAA